MENKYGDGDINNDKLSKDFYKKVIQELRIARQAEEIKSLKQKIEDKEEEDRLNRKLGY